MVKCFPPALVMNLHVRALWMLQRHDNAASCPGQWQLCAACMLACNVIIFVPSLQVATPLPYPCYATRTLRELDYMTWSPVIARNRIQWVPSSPMSYISMYVPLSVRENCCILGYLWNIYFIPLTLRFSEFYKEKCYDDFTIRSFRYTLVKPLSSSGV